MRYKAAVIGCGRVGSTFEEDPNIRYIASHAGAYNASSGTDLVGVCDIDDDKLKTCMNRWEVDGDTNFLALIKKHRPEIVSICTPTETHFSILEEVVKFPFVKGVFCEKPIAHDVKSGVKMVDLCMENGIVLQVNHLRRFDLLHKNVRSYTTREILGKIKHINFYYTNGIYNTGSHMFDLMRFFCGDAHSAFATKSDIRVFNKEDVNYDGMVTFKNGVKASFHACDMQNFLIFEMDILCERGRMTIIDSGFNVQCYTTGKSNRFSGHKELKITNAFFCTTYNRDFFLNGVNYLVYCIKNNCQSISSGQDGVAALEIIDAVRYSATCGEMLTVAKL